MSLQRFTTIVLSVAVLLAWSPRRVQAETNAFVHIVRPGETLSSIAQRYYGDSQREAVIVAENGLGDADDGPVIVVGLRLIIPWIAHETIEEERTWPQIATAHYGDPRRTEVLIEANSHVTSPDVGAEIRIPYPLRHVTRPGDTLRRVAEMYYGEASASRRLGTFNSLRGGGRRRLRTGRIILIPLDDLVLSDEGRRVVEQATGSAPTGGEVMALQSQINGRVQDLAEHNRRGRFARALSLGNRLLGLTEGGGSLTVSQRIEILKQLAVAYVAIGEEDLATDAFVAVLELDPTLELTATWFSPTVRQALERARQRVREGTEGSDGNEEDESAPERQDGPEQPD